MFELHIERLKSPDRLIRLNAISDLSDLKDPRSIPFFIDLLNDPNSDSRCRATYGLVKLRAVSPLIDSLSNSDPSVRRIAVYELGVFKEYQIVTKLIDMLLHDPDARVREMVVGILNHLKATQAISVLILAMQDEEALVRDHIAYTLGEVGDLRALPTLLYAVQNDEFDVRDAAATALEKLGTPEALEAASEWWKIRGEY